MSYSEKLYPHLPTAPMEQQEQNDEAAQMYRLKMISEKEKFLRDEITLRETQKKKKKRIAKIMGRNDTFLVLTSTGLGAGGLTCLLTGIGIPVAIVLDTLAHVFGSGSLLTQSQQKKMKAKAQKHENIKVIAESKLDSILSLISKAVQDATISHQEYDFILKEVAHYRHMKEEIRDKSKKTIENLNKEQREKLLAEGRLKGKQDLLKQMETMK